MILEPRSIRSIVVPLDGSPLAEEALPLAEAIAQRAHAKLKLVLVHAPNPATSPELDYVKLELAMVKAHRDYLKSVAARLRERLGRAVSSAVIPGGPPAQILSEHAQELGADLVVLTTHGRGGLGRAWLGSVADQLIRSSKVPLLVLRPGQAGAAKAGASVRNVMVPLDGSGLAEAALEPAAELARLWDAELSLVQVVQPVVLISDQQSLVNLVELTDIRRETAEAYVQQQAERLREAGIKASGTVIEGGGVAEPLIDLATRNRVGLLALATAGLGGVKRLVLGSVADKLVRGAAVPVLVVRPSGKPSRRSSHFRGVSGRPAAVV